MIGSAVQTPLSIPRTGRTRVRRRSGHRTTNPCRPTPPRLLTGQGTYQETWRDQCLVVWTRAQFEPLNRVGVASGWIGVSIPRVFILEFYLEPLIKCWNFSCKQKGDGLRSWSLRVNGSERRVQHGASQRDTTTAADHAGFIHASTQPTQPHDAARRSEATPRGRNQTKTQQIQVRGRRNHSVQPKIAKNNRPRKLEHEHYLCLKNDRWKFHKTVWWLEANGSELADLHSLEESNF